MTKTIQSADQIIELAEAAKASGEYEIIRDSDNAQVYVDFGYFACGYKIGGFDGLPVNGLPDEALPIWNDNGVDVEDPHEFDFESLARDVCSVFGISKSDIPDSDEDGDP